MPNLSHIGGKGSISTLPVKAKSQRGRIKQNTGDTDLCISNPQKETATGKKHDDRSALIIRKKCL